MRPVARSEGRPHKEKGAKLTSELPVRDLLSEIAPFYLRMLGSNNDINLEHGADGPPPEVTDVRTTYLIICTFLAPIRPDSLRSRTVVRHNFGPVVLGRGDIVYRIERGHGPDVFVIKF